MTAKPNKKVTKLLNRPRLRFEAAILREHAAQKKAAAIANARPGDLIEGEGIFLCRWAPKDRDGISLGKLFNVFAAPEDLTDTTGTRVLLAYNDTVKAISSLKKWHGYNGAAFEDDAALYAALKDGAYKGWWFIPTLDLLAGTDSDDKKIQPDNLFTHRNTGAFKNTFCTAASGSGGGDFPDWYWSSLPEVKGSPWIRGVNINSGQECLNIKNYCRLSCRPVRLKSISG